MEGINIDKELLLAADAGSKDDVERLLEAGADKEARNINHATPLFIAASKGHAAVVEQLLATGADKEAKNNDQATPLYIAAYNGHTAVVDQLLAAGADKEAKNNYQATPLIAASSIGHTAVVEQLLAAGADKEAKNRFQETPLIIAAFYGHTAVVEKLLAAGADKEAKNNDQATPLYIAASYGHPAVVDQLLAAGADKEAKNKNQVTPLLTAVSYGNTAVVERLLAAGADKEAKNKNQETPLIIAAKKGNTEIVERLLAAGADINKRKGGETAKDIARKNGYMSIVRLIEAKEAESHMSQKWKGFSRSDIDTLNSIFETEGANPPAINISCCPICMKVVGPGQASQFEVERSEACRYMTHNCQTAGGYYHAQLYDKYANPEGLITWCTVCGRICTGHRHHKLVLAKDPKSQLLVTINPFDMVDVRNAEGRPTRNEAGRIIRRYDPDGACKLDGGGGLMEKLSRYHRMREFALELQDKIDEISFYEAVNGLIEETWNAPLNPKLVLPRIAKFKTWNIPSERFLELRNKVNVNIGTAANVPWPFEGRPDMMPIISAPGEGNTNAITMGDMERAVQLRHRKRNGEIVTHDKIDIHTLFGMDALGVFSAAGMPTFGMCFFGCGSVIYPDELQYVIDNSRGGAGAAAVDGLSEEKYAEYKAKIDMYRKRFNEAYRDNADFKARVDEDVIVARNMTIGGAGAGAGQGGGKRRHTRKRRVQRRKTRK